MIVQQDIYSNNIFLYSVLPLVKVIVDDDAKLSNKFKNKTAIIQISAKADPVKVGTYFIVNKGVWSVKKGVAEAADIELEFQSIPALNAFFAGKSKKLPKIKGIKNVSLLINTLKALTRMVKLLSLKTAPAKKEDKELLVKLYFYLLSSGISQLNKSNHPDVSKWVKMSPNRVYAWTVDNKPELSAYIRVKAGNSKSAHGEYKYSKPFFTMRFDSVDSALGILMETDNLIDSTIKGKLIMEGAPEFGAQIGDFMALVGSYAK
jgi:hypothetical protein